MRDRLVIAPQEHLDDVISVVGGLAMKRAASYGRAPVMPDLECAAIILGYVGQAPREMIEWRSFYVRGAAHDYALRREICDAVDLDLLRLAPRRARRTRGRGHRRGRAGRSTRGRGI